MQLRFGDILDETERVVITHGLAEIIERNPS
jgi:hypothetical protein